jgi:hypothetical protein
VPDPQLVLAPEDEEEEESSDEEDDEEESKGVQVNGADEEDEDEDEDMEEVGVDHGTPAQTASIQPAVEREMDEDYDA